jgi:hypothetical protein
MAAIWAGVGAVTGIIGGIFGATQAEQQNQQSQQAHEEAKKLANEQARITNEYNKKAFEAEKNDYFAARQFQYNMAVRQWQYDTEIQDFRYLQEAKKYKGSADNYQQQLVFNSVGAQMAYESQQAQFNELMASTAFEGQGALIESLQNEGRASLMQAGGSRTKAVQSTLAEQGRNAAILAASLASGKREFERGMREVTLQRYGSDMAAAANLMIKPDRLPDLPTPVMGPARTFVEPAKVLPNAVAPASYSNPFLPLIGSVTSGAMGIAAASNN